MGFGQLLKTPVFYCRYTKAAEKFPCHGLEIKESELEGLLFEIISKQAVVIIGLDNIGDTGGLELKIAKQSKYEKLIRDCKEMKKRLYEQYLLREIDLESYREQKTVYDTKLKEVSGIYASLSSQTSQMKMDSEAQLKRLKLAKDISNETSLTQTLADTLIDKIYIYPDNRVEIVWGIQDFCEEKIF